MKIACTALILFFVPLVANAQNRKQPELFEVPEIRSSWDDLTDGIETCLLYTSDAADDQWRV